MIVDRYIILRFIKTFLFAILGLSVIFVVVDLLEHLDNFMRKNAGTDIILQYYIYYLPKIVEIITPIAVLLAVLFTVGGLSSKNEIVAMKSGGMSLYRLMLPFIVVGTMISMFTIYFNGWVVPQSSEKRLVLESEYVKKNKTGGPIRNFYFRESPVENFSLQYYNSEKYFGQKPALDSFTVGENARLAKRIEAQNIQWDTLNNQWLFVNAVKRVYRDDDISFTKYDTLKVDLSITHYELIKLKKQMDEMNYNEVKDYLIMLEAGGKDVRKEMIEYYGDYSFCFASLIVMFFGVPFASVKRKSGLAVQIGAALVISFVYLLSMKFSQTIGLAEGWNEILTGWMANILFAGLGLIVILKTRT
jgi:lipopolysaccharide export system permease protein